jgi:hypothetical protein
VRLFHVRNLLAVKIGQLAAHLFRLGVQCPG